MVESAPPPTSTGTMGRTPEGAYTITLTEQQAAEVNPQYDATARVEGSYEYYYRSMSHADYNTFIETGKMPGTTETFISPTQNFSESYQGVLVKFQLKAGITEILESIGVRAHGTRSANLLPNLPIVKSGWGNSKALFKPEGSQINIGLGRGKALNLFNESIVGYEVIKVVPQR